MSTREIQQNQNPNSGRDLGQISQRAPIKNIKAGEYVRLSENGPVWIRGDYDRRSKTYELYRFDEIGHSIYRKGSALAYYGFTF